MEYYLTKSGLNNYDLSRAYGLALIISYLVESKVILCDSGFFYRIITEQTPNLDDIARLNILIGWDLPWDGVFSTIKKSDRKLKKEKIKNFIENKQNINNILEKYSNIVLPELLNSKTENSETLFQSFDIGASKGIREYIRLQRNYSEGSQIYISIEDFILSVIGHLNCTIWQWNIVNRDKKLIAILLCPGADGLQIEKFIELKRQVQDAIKRHQAGTFAMLSYTATLLAKIFWIMKYKEQTFIPKFTSLIYGIMTKTGQQMKPFAGGIYPLDFLYQLVDLPQGGMIFDIWLDVFNKTNIVKGNDELALTLSEFIVHPSLETYERYIRTHLKSNMKKSIYTSLYDIETMGGIMRYV